jgi:hypothetical protein
VGPIRARGVDASVFNGITADRPTFLLDFLHNFYKYNCDVLGGKLMSERVVEDNWDCRPILRHAGGRR